MALLSLLQRIQSNSGFCSQEGSEQREIRNVTMRVDLDIAARKP